MDGIRKLGSGLTALGLAVVLVLRHFLILPAVGLALVILIWAFGSGIIEGVIAMVTIAVFVFAVVESRRRD